MMCLMSVNLVVIFSKVIEAHHWSTEPSSFLFFLQVILGYRSQVSIDHNLVHEAVSLLGRLMVSSGLLFSIYVHPLSYVIRIFIRISASSSLKYLNYVPSSKTSCVSSFVLISCGYFSFGQKRNVKWSVIPKFCIVV